MKRFLFIIVCGMSVNSFASAAQLRNAIARNDQATLISLLKQGDADVNGEQDPYNSLPLIEACKRNRQDMILALLEYDADPNQVDRSEKNKTQTALHVGITCCKSDLIKTMIQTYEAVPTAQTVLGGYTPLFLAAKIGHVSMVQALLGCGGAPSMDTPSGPNCLYPIEIAALMGHLKIVRKLAVTKPATVTRESRFGWTPLKMALSAKHIHIVQMLKRDYGIECTDADREWVRNPRNLLQCNLLERKLKR